jgi:hypothetical protein
MHPLVWVLDHKVVRQRLEHQFLVGKNAVTPLPVLLALLVDDELGVLLGYLRNRDDELLCLATVFFGLVGEEERGRGDVLENVN